MDFGIFAVLYRSYLTKYVKHIAVSDGVERMNSNQIHRRTCFYPPPSMERGGRGLTIETQRAYPSVRRSHFHIKFLRDPYYFLS